MPVLNVYIAKFPSFINEPISILYVLSRNWQKTKADLQKAAVPRQIPMSIPGPSVLSKAPSPYCITY